MRGVIMSAKGKYAVLLTKSGDFVKVKNKNYSIGDTVSISSNIPRICAMAASLFLVLGGISSYFIPTGYISVDINPSLLMTVNIYDRVIDTKALNDDAVKLLSQADVRVKNTEDAIDILIKKSEEIGYINDNNKDVIIELVSDINSFNPRNYGQIEVSMEKADREDLRNAQTMGVSIAKAKAIEEYTRQKGGEMLHNADMLKNKSVKEIRREFNVAKDNPPVPENIQSDNKESDKIHEQPKENNNTNSSNQRPAELKIERGVSYAPVLTEPKVFSDIKSDKPMQEQSFTNEPVPPNPISPIHNEPIFDMKEQPIHNELVNDKPPQRPLINDTLDNNLNREQNNVNDIPNQGQPVINSPIKKPPLNNIHNQKHQADNEPAKEPVTGSQSQKPTVNDNPNQGQSPQNEPVIDRPKQEQQINDTPQNQEEPIRKEPTMDNPKPPANDRPSQGQQTDNENINDRPIQEQPSHNEPITDNEKPPANTKPQDNPKPEGNKHNENHINEREPSPPITEHNTPQEPNTPPKNGGSEQNQPGGNGQEPR